MSITEPRPLRADALRNRERVVAAAAAVFAERGVDASVPEVAERAGVGKATVYRSFPTKEHLIAAVVIERLEDFERRTLALLDDPDPWGALVELLAEGARRNCTDRAMTAAISADVVLPELTAARVSLWGAVERLMDRAKAQGRMHAGVRPADLRVLWAGVARVLVADGVEDPAVWRRYAVLVANALRADDVAAIGLDG
jgi:AcrR family transcriptional regulator